MPPNNIDWRLPPQAGDRMMEMVPMPIELNIIEDDKQAACDLIGTDTYGQPHWTVETIPDCNRVVLAFARHRIRHTFNKETNDAGE